MSTDEHRTVKAAKTPAEYPDLLKEFGPNKDQHVVNRVGCHIELWNASHAAWALSIATLRAVLASAVAAPSTARPATPRGQFIATLIAEQAGSGLSNSGIIVFMASRASPCSPTFSKPLRNTSSASLWPLRGEPLKGELAAYH